MGFEEVSGEVVRGISRVREGRVKAEEERARAKGKEGKL